MTKNGVNKDDPVRDASKTLVSRSSCTHVEWEVGWSTKKLRVHDLSKKMGRFDGGGECY